MPGLQLSNNLLSKIKIAFTNITQYPHISIDFVTQSNTATKYG